MISVKSWTFFKKVIVGMVMVLLLNSLASITPVLASNSENNMERTINLDKDTKQKISEMSEYLVYDQKVKEWHFSEDIVSDGVINQEQHNETKKVILGNSQRALPLALVIILKALGGIIGGTAVAKITSHFLKWGISSGCKKFKKYKVIKSFCKANGYL